MAEENVIVPHIFSRSSIHVDYTEGLALYLVSFTVWVVRREPTIFLNLYAESASFVSLNEVKTTECV